MQREKRNHGNKITVVKSLPGNNELRFGASDIVINGLLRARLTPVPTNRDRVAPGFILFGLCKALTSDLEMEYKIYVSLVNSDTYADTT